MDIIFLGHQGWMLKSKSTAILIDPILTDSFGTSKYVQFKLFPPRSINLDKLPKISGIFITNEHLDHFHLPSLKLLDKSVPVYVGNTMPMCVKETIRNLGFELLELCNTELVKVEYLNVKFYIGSPSVPSWEKRCYQLYITAEDEKNTGVFIQSDTLVNEYFISQVNTGLESCPKIFIATNNGQILSEDSYGAFDNLLPLDSSSKDGCVGIGILEEILVQYPAQLPGLSTLLLSGSGYIIDNENSKPFLFSEVEKINGYLAELSMGIHAQLLYPGEQIAFDDMGRKSQSKVDWINLDMNLYKQLNERLKLPEQTINGLSAPIFSDDNDEEAFDRSQREIDLELQTMAKLILLSPLGRSLLLINEYLNGPLDSYRFAIKLKLNESKSVLYKLDINSASFSLVFIIDSDLTQEYPFGIELYLVDFVALLHGKIQIWELATTNMRQWYLGDKLQSPVAFLYSYFSEQIRPDLAYRVYETINAQ